MISNQQYWKQISAYLAGHLSEQERIELEAWINASKENATLFTEAKRIWESSGLKHQLATDETDTHWQELQEKLRSEKHFSLFPSGLWLRIAAGIALIAGLTYTIVRLNAPEEITIHATAEVMSFYLPDSTRVWLNANSTFTYFDNYGEENRRTRLNGEAYFKVRRNEAVPFVVNTTEAMIHVLGTSFNIKEDTTGTTILTVAEGRVKFSVIEESEGVEVAKDEKAIALKDGSITKYANPDPSFAHWRTIRNPEFATERDHAEQFVTLNYSWRKLTNKKSLIKGALLNRAALASYKNTVLKITLVNGKGKTQTTRITIPETLEPERSLSFEKQLDILNDTDHLRVEVEKADAVQ
jgi:ferric-dicitrate binding protein FerR (iron transport regulator)